MEIGVRVETERWNEATGKPLHVASAYLVFVAIDEDGSPREIPGLAPEDDEQRRRSREAEIRRSHRLARKQEIDEGRTGAP
jgi:acyl-CoA hydrolase